MEKERQRLEIEDKRKIMHGRAEVFKKAIQSYMDSLPFNHVGIMPGDIAAFSRFKTILAPEDGALDAQITTDDFTQAVAALPKLAKKWRAAKDRVLLEILGEDATQDDLTDALFHCNQCGCQIGYPRALVHSCSIRPSIWCQVTNKSPLGMCLNYLDFVPWKSHYSQSEAIPMFKRVIRQCGLNPKSTTWGDLANSNAVFRMVSNIAWDPKERLVDVPFIVCDLQSHLVYLRY
jgi:hypothetical protein